MAAESPLPMVPAEQYSRLEGGTSTGGPLLGTRDSICKLSGDTFVHRAEWINSLTQTTIVTENLLLNGAGLGLKVQCEWKKSGLAARSS